MKKYLLLSAAVMAAIMTSCTEKSYEEETNRVYIEDLTVETVAHEYIEESRWNSPNILAPETKTDVTKYADLLELDSTLVKYEDVLANVQKLNTKGDLVIMMHRIPKFVVVSADGKATCYKDFRNLGNEIVSLDLTNCICATCVGYVTDSYIALLTPDQRINNWHTDHLRRCLDFYSLADGTYLGSMKLPKEVSYMWLQDIHFENGLLEVYYTDALFSEKYTYKFSKDITSLLNKK